jgi:RNA polymerase sigma factor (sigma-70 family)
MKKNTKYVIKKHKDLVEACVRNDRNAQIKIYDLYYKVMYNSSIRIVSDSFIAEDIMQESFLDAFNKIKSFEWRSSFGVWLKRIVVNKSLDYVRNTKKGVSLEDEMIDIPDEGNNYVIESEYNNVRLEEVNSAIKLLAENYRIIIVLHLFEGYDHHEIAQILDIPYNNVRVRYLRAKRKLMEEVMNVKNQHVLN